MPPNTTQQEDLAHQDEEFEKLVPPQAAPRDYDIVYRNVITFGYWHLAALYGLYLCFTEAKWATIGLAFFLYVLAAIGITAGAHRLWAHKAYKAKLPLQIILMVMNTLAFQNTAIDWVRDHRLHHKYSDTDADPHNSTRGFFYSHVGWLLVKKHPEVKRRGKLIDLSDLYENPVLVFQKKYAIPFISIVTFILPTVTPMYFWGESFKCSWNITMLRYVCNLNMSFFVNSAAHLWGNRPYDKDIKAVQNISVSFISLGEGFHNYHHVFPWDYKTAELGNNSLNVTTKFIDFCARFGWAYDLKAVSNETVQRRCYRTGDGTDKYALPLISLVTFILPTAIPMYLWGESLKCAWNITMLRYVCNLNIAFLVNSAAHLWGTRPYDKNIQPVQSIPVSFIAFGEGFHNYHHVFPWDYKAAELGNNTLNISTKFIDFFAWIGWAYDLKTVSDDTIERRSARTGDGTNKWGMSKKAD